MKRVSGIWNGTGAACYLGFGSVPDQVELIALESSDEDRIMWTRDMMRSAEMVQGLLYNATDVQGAPLTANGIEPHFGGVALTSANQTDTTYGGGVFLSWDHYDYRRVNSTENGIVGDAVASDIDKWTLTTSGSQTGKFNADVTGTYIGEGSVIKIAGREYTILALTAGQGVADDEVTLNQDAPSGNVEFIGGKSGMKPLAIGKSSVAGIKVNATSTINSNDELNAFVATWFDN